MCDFIGISIRGVGLDSLSAEDGDSSARGSLLADGNDPCARSGLMPTAVVGRQARPLG
jgi:hypothetical protein